MEVQKFDEHELYVEKAHQLYWHLQWETLTFFCIVAFNALIDVLTLLMFEIGYEGLWWKNKIYCVYKLVMKFTGIILQIYIYLFFLSSKVKEE